LNTREGELRGFVCLPPAAGSEAPRSLIFGLKTRGGCTSGFPAVRTTARLALREMIAQHPDDPMLQHWSGPLAEMLPFETFKDLWQRSVKAQRQPLQAQIEAENHRAFFTCSCSWRVFRC